MNRQRGERGKLFCAAALCAVLGAAGVVCAAATAPSVTGGLSVAAAGFILPDGALAAAREGELFAPAASSEQAASSAVSAPSSL